MSHECRRRTSALATVVKNILTTNSVASVFISDLPFVGLFNNRNGLADHEVPLTRAMQWRSMLRPVRVKGNRNRRDLLDTFPGQGGGHPLAGWGCR